MINPNTTGSVEHNVRRHSAQVTGGVFRMSFETCKNDIFELVDILRQSREEASAAASTLPREDASLKLSGRR